MGEIHAFAGAIHREFPASNRAHGIDREQERRDAVEVIAVLGIARAVS
jgi:hypothetical protein